MKRREILKLGAALPASAGAQQHPHTAPVKPAAQPAWKPRLFDEHQNDTVAVLAELIIPSTDTPGAQAAQVNRYIDLLLHDGPANQREAFLAGLAWLDGYAIRNHRRPFLRLAKERQTAILTALDSGSEPDLEPGRRFFRQMKSLAARVYYATEIGFKELNKGGRVPATFGCRDPEHGAA